MDIGEWGEVAGWNDDDKDGDGHPMDIGEWGMVYINENGDSIFAHPYQFLENGYFNTNFIPIMQHYTTIDYVGIDEISHNTGIYNNPIDYNSVSWSIEGSSLSISWSSIDSWYSPPFYYDSSGNLILIDMYVGNESIYYEINYNFSFNYYNCTVSNNSYSNSISTTNSEILIDNINLSSGNCFYINSKSGYGNIAGPFLLSNFIFCF